MYSLRILEDNIFRFYSGIVEFGQSMYYAVQMTDLYKTVSSNIDQEADKVPKSDVVIRFELPRMTWEWSLLM